MVTVWFFFFKQKTAYEMRISDWSSDVCSSDLTELYQRCARVRGNGKSGCRLLTSKPSFLGLAVTVSLPGRVLPVAPQNRAMLVGEAGQPAFDRLGPHDADLHAFGDRGAIEHRGPPAPDVREATYLLDRPEARRGGDRGVSKFRS